MAVCVCVCVCVCVSPSELPFKKRETRQDMETCRWPSVSTRSVAMETPDTNGPQAERGGEKESERERERE